MDGFVLEKRDPRVTDWFLMSSIYPTLVLSVGYVVYAKIVGPWHMRNSDPWNVKTPLMLYNLIQIIGNIWLLQRYLKFGWLAGYNLVCQDVERDADPSSNGYQMAVTIWWATMFRYLDFMDTFFFIVKKKFGHVNALQTIHHFLMPIYGWIVLNYGPGGQDSFGGMVNTIVHTIMYFYYFMAALGPQYQKYLWWKRYLTTFQIVQFVIGFSKSIIVALGIVECGYPWQVSAVTSMNMGLMFVLFVHFYIQSYISKPSSKKRSE